MHRVSVMLHVHDCRLTVAPRLQKIGRQLIKCIKDSSYRLIHMYVAAAESNICENLPKCFNKRHNHVIKLVYSIKCIDAPLLQVWTLLYNSMAAFPNPLKRAENGRVYKGIRVSKLAREKSRVPLGNFFMSCNCCCLSIIVFFFCNFH